MKKFRKIRWDRVGLIVGIIIVLVAFFVYRGIDKKEKKSYSKAVDSKPIVKEEKYIVALDPGHGGYDPGSSSEDGILEKDLTLDIALKVGKLLEKENVKVVYTRTSDKVSWVDDNVEDLYTRCKIVNEKNADVFISIHMNFIEEMQDEVYGSEVWYSSSNPGGKKFATVMEKALKEGNYTESRGIRDDADSPVYIFYGSKMPTILIETGFISNKKDMSVINSKKGQEKIAGAIKEGILNYLKTK